MKFEFSTDNSFPVKGIYFWQIVLIPTISIAQFRGENFEDVESYIVVDFEWLFWSVAILIK